MSKSPMSKRDRFDPRTVRAYHAAGLPEVFASRQQPDGGHEILLYDEIGYDGVRAKDFAQALAKIGPDSKVTVRINSPGGSAFDGIAIYSMLRNRKAPVATVVDGLAASAASVVAMAGSTVSMHDTASMMVHNSHGVVVGNKHDLATMSKHLEEMDSKMQRIYSSKTGSTPEVIAALMDAETWLSSSSAKAAGFIDDVIEAPERANLNAQALAGADIVRVGYKQPYDYLRATRARYAVPAYAQYDPDNDGDDDVAEAIGLVQQAIGNCSDAIEALTGTAPDDAEAMTYVDPQMGAMGALGDEIEDVQAALADLDEAFDALMADGEALRATEREKRLRRLRIAASA